jgi:hypothetical protein
VSDLQLSSGFLLVTKLACTRTETIAKLSLRVIHVRIGLVVMDCKGFHRDPRTGFGDISCLGDGFL